MPSGRNPAVNLFTAGRRLLDATKNCMHSRTIRNCRQFLIEKGTIWRYFGKNTVILLSFKKCYPNLEDVAASGNNKVFGNKVTRQLQIVITILECDSMDFDEQRLEFQVAAHLCSRYYG